VQNNVDTGKKKFGVNQILRAIGTVISTVLFIWLLSKQDWLVIWQNLKQFPAWLWPVCLLLVISGMICNALRWYLLLRAQKVQIPFGEVIRTVFAGAFASNFLPSTIGGDAFRIISLLRFTKDKALSVASIVVDRALNVLATLTVLPFSWITFGDQLFHLVFQVETAPAASLAVPGLKKVYAFFQRIVKRLFEAFAGWARQPWVLAGGFGISWMSIFVTYVNVWLLAQFLGIPVNLVQVMGVAAIVYLVTLLPISFNGYGVREVIYTTLYVSLGATTEQAATLALVSRFFMLLETLPGALWLSNIISSKNDMTHQQ